MKTYICIDDVRLAIPGLEGVSVPLDLFNTSSATIPDDLEDLDMDRYILIHFNLNHNRMSICNALQPLRSAFQGRSINIWRRVTPPFQENLPWLKNYLFFLLKT